MSEIIFLDDIKKEIVSSEKSILTFGFKKFQDEKRGDFNNLFFYNHTFNDEELDYLVEIAKDEKGFNLGLMLNQQFESTSDYINTISKLYRYSEGKLNYYLIRNLQKDSTLRENKVVRSTLLDAYHLSGTHGPINIDRADLKYLPGGSLDLFKEKIDQIKVRYEFKSLKLV
ncbi:hypothetical protein J4403_04300 [Candidatus Woesearchaeota archaeon]|nr:hypothetical protein [Candidatus Woesearchaeota archaeon]